MPGIEKEKESSHLFIQFLGVPASGETTCANRRFFYGLVRNDSFPKPDVLIYLKVSFPKMLRGIKERAQRDPTRKAELQESESYWKRLWELHEEWVAGNPLGLNMFILDMDKYDISNYFNREQQLGAVFEELNKQIKFY